MGADEIPAETTPVAGRAAGGPAVFPHPTGSFVGRRVEIDRVLRLLSEEYLFVVYGVPGIGKSELVYKVIQEARRRASWKDVEPVLVEAEPGRGVEHFVARLRARLGLPMSGSPDALPIADYLRDELLEIAAAMEDRPRFLFVDDAHHLDRRVVEVILGYLARNLHASRIFVASRTVLEGEAEFGAPVVVRLEPLDSAAANQMIDALADRLHVKLSDRRALAIRSRGSPFLIQRELARLSLGYDARDDVLQRTLEDLTPSCRRLLVLVSAFHGRLPMSCAARGFESEELSICLDRLRRRFLVTVADDVMVAHDLVRSAVEETTSGQEWSAAHRLAGAHFLDAYFADPDRNPIELVAAVHHLVAAGDHSEAWRTVAEWERRIVASGIDHLLADDLEAMAAALPRRRFPIELLRARILARRSVVGGAEAILERISREPGAEQSVPFLLLAGEVAQRTGDLERAEELFGWARDAARGASDRFHAALHLGAVSALRGNGDRARETARKALADLPWPSARHRGRAGWITAFSYEIEQRFDDALVVIDEALAGLREQHQEDLTARLDMLKAVALVECDRLGEARETVAQLRRRALGSLALREQIAALCHAIVGMARGEMRGAAVGLRHAVDRLREQGDQLYACIGAMYLVEAWLALGELDRALDLADETVESALDAGLVTLVPQVMALRARGLGRAGRFTEACERAEEALAQPLVPVRTALVAYSVLAEVEGLQADFEASRRALERASGLLNEEASASLRARLRAFEAEVDALAGAFDSAIETGEHAWRYFAGCGRRYEAAWCAGISATAYLGRGGRADLILAEKMIAKGQELAAGGGYELLGLRFTVLEAKLEERRGSGDARSRELAENALRAYPPGADSVELRAVRALIQGQASGGELPAGGADLPSSGPTGGRTAWSMSDRTGTRRIGEAELRDVEAARELVVDLTRGAICGARGAHHLKNRPVMCRLLAELVARQGEPLSAAHLYARVWGGAEYHPLRHRSTVYVAVTRLRKALTTFFPDRELIETVPGGWRLTEAIDACVVQQSRAEP